MPSEGLAHGVLSTITLPMVLRAAPLSAPSLLLVDGVARRIHALAKVHLEVDVAGVGGARSGNKNIC